MQRTTKQGAVYVRAEPNRARWRVIVLGPQSAKGTRPRRSFIFEAEGAARDYADECRAELEVEGLTVAQAIDAHRDNLLADGVKRGTAETARARLLSVLGDALDLDLLALSPRHVKRAWLAYVEQPTRTGRPPSVATARGTLAELRRLCRWARSGGRLDGDPTEGLRVRGRANRGKAQLRRDEAARYWQTGLELARAGDVGALAALLPLALGLRRGEVFALAPRDIDGGGSVLVVADAKTPAGERELELPAELGELLAGALPWPGASPHWVSYQVRRLCRLADVPRVTAHGMRGTHATLATDVGIAAPLIVAQLGHTSHEVTRRHYIAPGADERANARRTLRVLQGGLDG